MLFRSACPHLSVLATSRLPLELPFAVDVQLRSAVDPTLVADAAQLWAGTVAWYEPSFDTDLLRSIRRGAAIWPPLRRLLDQPEPASLELDDDEAMELFGAAAVDLGAAGIEVLIPSALTRTLRAEAHVEPPPGAEDGPSSFDLASVCHLTWRATLDGRPVSDAELAALAASRRPLVKVNDEWVVVDPHVVAKLARRDRMTAADALSAALGGQAVVDDEVVDVVVDGPIADLADRLRRATGPTELADPPGLAAELRPYQRRGVSWIQDMSVLGFGGVLADDMGLGKTIQVIALLLLMRKHAIAGPHLIVLPASLLANWRAELARFGPDLRVHTAHRSVPDGDSPAADVDVVLTTYATLQRQAWLKDQAWGLVVLFIAVTSLALLLISI